MCIYIYIYIINTSISNNRALPRTAWSPDGRKSRDITTIIIIIITTIINILLLLQQLLLLLIIINMKNI